MKERENEVPLRCRDGNLKMKVTVSLSSYVEV